MNLRLAKDDCFSLTSQPSGVNCVKEMLRPQVKVDYLISWALGCQVVRIGKSNLIQHGGDNKGFRAYATASVERKSGYVIMTNGDNGGVVIKNLASGEILNRFLAG